MFARQAPWMLAVLVERFTILSTASRVVPSRAPARSLKRNKPNQEDHMTCAAVAPAREASEPVSNVCIQKLYLVKCTRAPTFENILRRITCAGFVLALRV
jgi:hypothetical protein